MKTGLAPKQSWGLQRALKRGVGRARTWALQVWSPLSFNVDHAASRKAREISRKAERKAKIPQAAPPSSIIPSWVPQVPRTIGWVGLVLNATRAFVWQGSPLLKLVAGGSGFSAPSAWPIMPRSVVSIAGSISMPGTSSSVLRPSFPVTMHHMLRPAVAMETGVARRMEVGIQQALERSLSLHDLVGSYECMAYGKQLKNDWHHVELLLSEDGTHLVWRNNADVHWSAIPTENALVYRVGPECPYQGQGYTEMRVQLDGSGGVSSIQGPHEESYVKKGEGSRGPLVASQEQLPLLLAWDHTPRQHFNVVAAHPQLTPFGLRIKAERWSAPVVDIAQELTFIWGMPCEAKRLTSRMLHDQKWDTLSLLRKLQRKLISFQGSWETSQPNSTMPHRCTNIENKNRNLEEATPILAATAPKMSKAASMRNVRRKTAQLKSMWRKLAHRWEATRRAAQLRNTRLNGSSVQGRRHQPNTGRHPGFVRGIPIEAAEVLAERNSRAGAARKRLPRTMRPHVTRSGAVRSARRWIKLQRALRAAQRNMRVPKAPMQQPRQSLPATQQQREKREKGAQDPIPQGAVQGEATWFEGEAQEREPSPREDYEDHQEEPQSEEQDSWGECLLGLMIMALVAGLGMLFGWRDIAALILAGLKQVEDETADVADEKQGQGPPLALTLPDGSATKDASEECNAEEESVMVDKAIEDLVEELEEEWEQEWVEEESDPPIQEPKEHADAPNDVKEVDLGEAWVEDGFDQAEEEEWTLLDADE